jgi:CoA:oxalate CoA-transferase
MLQPDRYWADFSGAIGRPELEADARFATMGVRAGNCAALIEILDQVFASRPRAEWLDVLRKGGDFIFTIVNSLNDLPDDPQMIANDYIRDFDHPTHGPTKYVGIPVRLSETPGSIRAPAPEHGQHTELLLTELLGYGWDEVGALRERGVI